MIALLILIDTILGIVSFCLIASVIISWLVAFNVINSYQSFVRTVLTILHAITDPILRPIRRLVPSVNGMDLSPLIAILIVVFLRNLIKYDIVPMVS